MRKITQNRFLNLLWILVLPVVFSACEDEEYAIPTAKTELQNDVIKRSLGPNLVGLDIEFVYAMALGKGRGKLVSAEVEASIAGAEQTYLENKSYYTNGSGVDVGVQVGSPSSNSGGKTTVTFTTDTVAAALRYFYRIPESARGKEVSFTFSATASTGEKVTYTMGPYKVAKMDMKLDIPVTDAAKCFISLEDMTVYNATEAAANPAKIDVVYLYRALTTVTFGHSLVAPSSTAYLPGVTLPAGVNRTAKISKVWGLRDQQLARLQYGVFIDDLDFQELDIAAAPDYGVNMKAESGAWVETADGKYRAYIYVNSVNNTTKSAVISIKRYTM